MPVYWLETNISMLLFERFNTAAKVFAFPLKDIIGLYFIQWSRIFLPLKMIILQLQNDRQTVKYFDLNTVAVNVFHSKID